jgi:hypothetical protein
MQTDLLHGELVHLTAATPEADLSRMLQWSQDSEFLRLLDADPARPWSARTLREDLESLPKDNSFGFMIRTRADDQTIGFVGLWVNHWVHADAWVGIGLGDRAYWGKGYGTDAMRVLLRFAFTELHLRNPLVREGRFCRGRPRAAGPAARRAALGRDLYGRHAGRVGKDGKSIRSHPSKVGRLASNLGLQTSDWNRS